MTWVARGARVLGDAWRGRVFARTARRLGWTFKHQDDDLSPGVLAELGVFGDLEFTCRNVAGAETDFGELLIGDLRPESGAGDLSFAVFRIEGRRLAPFEVELGEPLRLLRGFADDRAFAPLAEIAGLACVLGAGEWIAVLHAPGRVPIDELVDFARAVRRFASETASRPNAVGPSEQASDPSGPSGPSELAAAG